MCWSDLRSRTRMLLVRDRKDPRNENGNNQRIPLFAATGYDAWAIVEEQRARRSNDDDRIFPFNHRSVGTAFRRGCADREPSTTFIFMTCGTKEQVASSKLDSRLNKWRWSRVTRIGRCCGDIRISSRKCFTLSEQQGQRN